MLQLDEQLTFCIIFFSLLVKIDFGRGAGWPVHGRRGGRAVHRLGAGLKRVVMLSPVPTPFGKILVSLR